eukprot:Gb_31406 [translate_table: standard]
MKLKLEGLRIESSRLCLMNFKANTLITNFQHNFYKLTQLIQKPQALKNAVKTLSQNTSIMALRLGASKFATTLRIGCNKYLFTGRGLDIALVKLQDGTARGWFPPSFFFSLHYFVFCYRQFLVAWDHILFYTPKFPQQLLRKTKKPPPWDLPVTLEFPVTFFRRFTHITDGLKHAEQPHEWVKHEGQAATVDITHHAQDQLAEVVLVDLVRLKV